MHIATLICVERKVQGRGRIKSAAALCRCAASQRHTPSRNMCVLIPFQRTVPHYGRIERDVKKVEFGTWL